MVALAATARHERVAALSKGVGTEELELAGLVAAAGQAGGVVALHPERFRLHAEVWAEALHGLEGRREMGQRQTAIEGGGRHHPGRYRRAP